VSELDGDLGWMAISAGWRSALDGDVPELGRVSHEVKRVSRHRSPGESP
jgi:hypothetical protein